MTYDQFLRRHWGADEEVLRLLRGETRAYFGVGTEATTALDAWAGGLPFAGLDLGAGPTAASPPAAAS
jgi:spermidine dehydrogenase